MKCPERIGIAFPATSGIGTEAYKSILGYKNGAVRLQNSYFWNDIV